MNNTKINIGHIGLWVKNLETMRDFYVDIMGGNCGEKYSYPKKGFESYFITFGNNVAVEIMTSERINQQQIEICFGWAHLAFTMDSVESVDSFVNRVREIGIQIIGNPRLTGDGYYEAVISDPENNTIEICYKP